MGFIVTRKHEIHCGHRVVGHEGKCCNLHGHSYIFHLTCNGEELDHLGRVVDFSVIKNLLCKWLEETWDHKLILWQNDPWLTELAKIDKTVVSVPFNPTAENLVRYLVEEIGPRVFAGTAVKLSSVKVEETSKCSATYAI